MPFFSIVARSASITLLRLHSSTKAARGGLSLAARWASGCSAATATKVTPIIVSARVVKTQSSPLSPEDELPPPEEVEESGEANGGASYGKAKRTPMLFPIQFAC